MQRSALVRRNLRYFARSHLAVGLGVVVGTAALTGALLVGDSMRASLRQTALDRLGNVAYAMVSPRFIGETLDESIGEQYLPADEADTNRDDTPQPNTAPSAAAPLDSWSFVSAILLQGGITHADTSARVARIQVIGASQRFWSDVPAPLGDEPDSAGMHLATQRASQVAGRNVVLSRLLADELGAEVGDDVLLQLGAADPVPAETLLGRRDQPGTALRLTVREILPNEGIADFAVDARQQTPRNAFVPLQTLQRALDQAERANAILFTKVVPLDHQVAEQTARIQSALNAALTLEDLGLTLRADSTRHYFSLESNAILLDPPVEAAAIRAASNLDSPATPLLTYLANEIARAAPADDDERGSPAAIPYSTVTALDLASPAAPELHLVDGTKAPPLQPGEIYLNQWAADDLAVQPGDKIALTYYITGPFGRLTTESRQFTLSGVIRMDPVALDPGLTPEYEGITDTESVADWDPPFPVDLSKVREKDETYWDEHRAAPKAFVSLEDGRRLWAEEGERFGRATAIRFRPPPGDLQPAADQLRQALLAHVEPEALGLRFDPVRARALAAAEGSTDFGMLFIGFSSFLIAAAAMLMALLFRLGVERRASQVGLLLAEGYTPRAVARMLLAEGAVVAVIGCAVGLAAAAGYAWLMLAGLRTWWASATNAPFLVLHVPAVTLAVGFAASFAVAMASIAWSIRGLTRQSPRALLAGNLAPRGAARRTRRRWPLVFSAGLALALILLLLPLSGQAIPSALAFFGSGTGLLIAALALFAAWLGREQRPIVHRPGRAALFHLGVRNAPRNPGRSLLTAGLIASATFIIASLQAFHLDADADPADPNSGTGGFALLAQSARPLLHDIGSRAGREALNITQETAQLLRRAQVIPFRLRQGEESSCLNLYRPTQPKIVGATGTMIQRGGFAFASSLAETDVEADNPWRLLHRRFDDGAIPAIADEAAVIWQLKSGLGKDLTITDERGRPQTLRFVALLSQSALQDEIIIAEDRFTRLFPSVSGYGFFLIDVDADRPDELALALEKDLAPYAFDAASTIQRLQAYLAVQNTYLLTFQTLGGLGLILGTCGLAVVLLRNVWERRSELALMRAVGFSRSSLGWMVLSENAALVLAGLICGTVPALLATAPHLLERPETIPWATLGLTLVGVLLAGIGVGAVALRPTLRAPLIPALRAE